jgi:hypothetical protein
MDEKDYGFGLICLIGFSRSKTARKVFLELIKEISKEKYSSHLESKVYSARLLSPPIPFLIQTKPLTTEMALYSRKLFIMEPNMEELIYAKFNGQLSIPLKQELKSKIVCLNVPFSYMIPYVPELEKLLKLKLRQHAEEYVGIYA